MDGSPWYRRQETWYPNPATLVKPLSLFSHGSWRAELIFLLLSFNKYLLGACYVPCAKCAVASVDRTVII